jgi:tetratricopeptide (TPR) repeat protein
MSPTRCLAVALCALTIHTSARAGLYYSGETIAELPSQWRGFLLDHRALRQIAVKPASGAPAGPLRKQYLEAAAKLEQTAKERKLTADEAADLGALLVRLGEPGKAIEVLRVAERDHANHFRIAANLGTAWQLQGDLAQAAAYLQHAVKLAPGKYEKAEELQLKLVRLRRAEKKDAGGLDDLFGVRYLNDKAEYEPGRLGTEERKKIPAGAAALVQQLALWLPGDGRLLWQLGELANAHGDVKTGAAIMDGCVTEFGLNDAALRKHRQVSRAAADASEQGTAPTHEGHLGGLKTRSRRPLVGQFNLAELPPIDAKGVNALPWAVLAETQVNRDFKPTFPKYLKELDGKTISLAGFMQPLGEDAELSTFMLIEYPVGCWYCEVPEMTAIVFVDLPRNKTASFTRSLVKITGTLKLNETDPENFLYTIEKAKVSEAD